MATLLSDLAAFLSRILEYNMGVISSMKTNVTSRKLIKPATPTPSNLRTYNISAMDVLNTSMHVIRILYYSSFDEKMTKNLEESLAQVLTLFYPLAGRYVKDQHVVDCNDEGAVFSEAEVTCELETILNPSVKSELSLLNGLLPVGIGEADGATDPMLAIQLNKFRCGGLAIGLCASHRIFDPCSLGIFLTAWANVAAGGDPVVKPDFKYASMFPAENVPPVDFGVSRIRDDTVVKRFVFDKDAIATLRDRASPGWRSNISSGQRPPSRVVVVSSVITQAALRADRAKHGGNARAAYVVLEINVRERTVPPVPKDACGSWVSLSCLECTANETLSLEYQGLVSKIREIIVKGVKDCEKIFSDKAFGRWAMIDASSDAIKRGTSSEFKVIWFTDWSKFGDYEMDFGWGKPIWVSLCNAYLQDVVILMNTKENDGIEAWVYLHESDMAYFEQDEEIMMLTTN